MTASEYQPSYPYGTVQYKYEYFNVKKDGFGNIYTPKILNFEWHGKANFPLAKNVYLNVGLRAAFNYFVGLPT